jgi:outer membrane protein TolC
MITPQSFARAIVLVLMLVLPQSRAVAEPITMQQAVELARQNNLAVRAASENYQAALWGVRSARASLFPSVRFSSSMRRVDPDTYDRANASLVFLEEMGIDVEPFLYETTYETGFSASVPVFNGGRLWGGVGFAGATRDAALHSFESAARAIEVTAKEAYLAVLRAQALLGVARDAVSASEKRVREAGRKIEVGVSGRSELLRWEAQFAEDRTLLVDAENSLVLARLQLANILGLPLDADLEPEDVSRLELKARIEGFVGLTGDDLVSEAEARRLLASNPDFLVPGDAAGIEACEVTIARGAFLPSLNVQGSYGWKADGDIKPDNEVAWSVTALLEVPVFTSFKNLADYQMSRRSHFAAVRMKEDAERQMVVGLQAAAATLKSRLRALDAAERFVAQSEEHFGSMKNMFGQGMISDNDLIDARVVYDRSRIGYINALYDCFISLAELEQLVGKSPAVERKQ